MKALMVITVVIIPALTVFAFDLLRDAGEFKKIGHIFPARWREWMEPIRSSNFRQPRKRFCKPSQSQVLKISPEKGGEYQIEEVFLDDGRNISGSSVAAVSGQTLVIGAVFDGAFLVCELQEIYSVLLAGLMALIASGAM
ncbi:hypothetical protein GWO43_21045 [candidate division KSB1 bacterium]|nr:hypothetical protein [candidate division KSB1 bacterium]NIR70282.1 hypothetical protein [candidate division KSB1 bacterium]NIS26552.1 hypothetical protein [candidate division KSB1 bacterium]NIT73315.1 hypothetical protein [candidate division KSB1 bacterium]NIU23938.1 hypothetical protein [candidate division KSB1 bacterium]